MLAGVGKKINVAMCASIPPWRKAINTFRREYTEILHAGGPIILQNFYANLLEGVIIKIIACINKFWYVLRKFLCP